MTVSRKVDYVADSNQLVEGSNPSRPTIFVHPPAGPHPRPRDPEESVAPAHLRPGHHLLVDGELVAQGQVLQGDMAVSAAEEGKQSKQPEQECDHRAGIFSGSAQPEQSLGAGRSFGEGQESSTFVAGTLSS